MVEVYTMLTQGMWATSDLGTSHSHAIFFCYPWHQYFRGVGCLHCCILSDTKRRPSTFRQQWLLVVNKPLIKPSLLEGQLLGDCPIIYIYIPHDIPIISQYITLHHPIKP